MAKEAPLPPGHYRVTEMVPAVVKTGEPVFLIRAQDALAVDVVAYWIFRAEQIGVSPRKIASAKKVLKAMKRWKGRKTPD